MSRTPRGREVLAVSTAVAFGLTIASCDNDSGGNDYPSICHIDRPIDSGSMMVHSSEKPGKKYSGYNFNRNKSLRLVYDQDAETVEFIDVAPDGSTDKQSVPAENVPGHGE